MLTPAGHAKVMDFGLAKPMAPAGAKETPAETVTGLTSDGSTVGTLAAKATTYDVVGRPDVAAALKQGYAESGYAGALRRAADVELAKHGDEGGVKFDAASNYAMAGDHARALDWLEKAYADRDPNMPYIGCIPYFAPLRAEPRFQALLRQMNLP